MSAQHSLNSLSLHDVLRLVAYTKSMCTPKGPCIKYLRIIFFEREGECTTIVLHLHWDLSIKVRNVWVELREQESGEGTKFRMVGVI